MAGKPVHKPDGATMRDIKAVLRRPGMTKAKAAEHLGMSRSTLYRLLDQAGRR